MRRAVSKKIFKWEGLSQKNKVTESVRSTPPKTESPAAAPGKVEVPSETKVSVHFGRAVYLKGDNNEKYLNTGLSVEQELPPMLMFDPFRLIVGAEVNQYFHRSSEKNLYDLALKLGPKLKSKYFEMDLQGIGAVTMNNNGDSSVDGGVLAKFGMAINDRFSAQMYLSRTKSFSRFGLSLGYSL